MYNTSHCYYCFWFIEINFLNKCWESLSGSAINTQVINLTGVSQFVSQCLTRWQLIKGGDLWLWMGNASRYGEKSQTGVQSLSSWSWWRKHFTSCTNALCYERRFTCVHTGTQETLMCRLFVCFEFSFKLTLLTWRESFSLNSHLL